MRSSCKPLYRASPRATSALYSQPELSNTHETPLNRYKVSQLEYVFAFNLFILSPSTNMSGLSSFFLHKCVQMVNKGFCFCMKLCTSSKFLHCLIILKLALYSGVPSSVSQLIDLSPVSVSCPSRRGIHEEGNGSVHQKLFFEHRSSLL